MPDFDADDGGLPAELDDGDDIMDSGGRRGADGLARD